VLTFIGFGIASCGAHALLNFQQFNFFSVNFRAAQSLTAAFVQLPLQAHLYSATAAAVVQSLLHEPCSVYNSALFYVRQTVSRIL